MLSLPAACPGSVVCLRLSSYPTPAAVSLLNGPSRILQLSRLQKLLHQLQNPVCRLSPACVSVVRQSRSAALLWPRDGAVGESRRAVIQIQTQRFSLWLYPITEGAPNRDPGGISEITDPEEKHLYLTWVLITTQPCIFLKA